MSNKCFKSTGTIRVKLSNGSLSQIFFTPDDDSAVRRGDKRYAVFLQGSKHCLVKKLGDAGEGVPIKVNKADLPGLVEAAVQQTLVEVAVKKRSDLALRAITIPAPGKQK